MGNCSCNFKADSEKDNVIGTIVSLYLLAISKSMFQFQYIIGRGGFGKVWKVQKKSSGHYYAIKEMSKAKIIAKKSEKSVMNEKNILAKLRNQYNFK